MHYLWIIPSITTHLLKNKFDVITGYPPNTHPQKLKYSSSSKFIRDQTKITRKCLMRQIFDPSLPHHNMRPLSVREI
jgi:hypothetical protein